MRAPGFIFPADLQDECHGGHAGENFSRTLLSRRVRVMFHISTSLRLTEANLYPRTELPQSRCPQGMYRQKSDFLCVPIGTCVPIFRFITYLEYG